jgi:hypothetical protein
VVLEVLSITPSLTATTAGTWWWMATISWALSTHPEDGELNMPRAMSVRSATYWKNRNTPSPACTSMGGVCRKQMSAPCSWACCVSSTQSFAEAALVQAWITVPGTTDRASATATSRSRLRSFVVSDHHSPTPLVSQSMSWRRSPTQ